MRGRARGQAYSISSAGGFRVEGRLSYHTPSPAAYWTFTEAVSLMSLDESPIIT
jgi:hypothetical protein